MTTLANLLSQLQSEVPAVNSVPTTTQYTQAIKDAAAEFSRRCGLTKFAELSIVSGTAAYDLPADFLKLVMLENLAGADGVILSDAGIIPIAADWEETYQIVNKVIKFSPTPTYTLTRDYRYKAAWILTGGSGSETYADMGDDEAQVVMLKARQLATEKLSNALASSGGQYSFGAVSVNKGSGMDSLVKQVYSLQGQFIEACEHYNGARLEIS
jgi:hypothetical protein